MMRAVPARIALLALCLALAPSMALPAAGQLLEVAAHRCYSMHVSPVETEAVIGQRVDFNGSAIVREGCDPVTVTWSYTAKTPNLIVTPDPFPGVDVAVRPMPGAFADSQVVFKAEFRDADTGRFVTAISRLIRIDVLDGLRDPDLWMDWEVGLPQMIFEGRPFSFTATIHNWGDAAAPSSATSFTIEDQYAIAFECPPLAIDEACYPVFSPRVDTAGTYRWTVCADSRGEIYEQDETNNCESGYLEVLPLRDADLALDALLVHPSPTAVGQPTQVTAVVRNVGSTRSFGSTVFLELPDETVTMDCPELVSGTTCSRTFAWDPQAVGQFTLVASVQHDAPEPDTTDNTRTKRVTVEDTHPLPDFAVTVGDLTLSPAAPRAGEDLTVTVRMRNLGADFVWNEPSLAIALAGPGIPFTRLPCPTTMLTGAVCEHSITVQAPQPGIYSFWAEADTNDVVPEPNENDNQRFLTFAVEGDDDRVTCQGLWTLSGTGSTEFSTSSPGSVVDDCEVYFGQNWPTACYRTNGDEGLQAVWHKPYSSPCPTSVTVTDSNPPYETWTFAVSID